MALDQESFEVVVVGAGPVGLTLAFELGRRGVRTALLERHPAPQFWPKMERCNARTMEMFRRVGLAERIRAAGLPADVPMDVFIILAMDRPPILRLPYPSVAEARKRLAAVNDGSEPCEPYQLVSQYTLEPLLKSAVESLPTVSVRYGVEVEAVGQDSRCAYAYARGPGGEVRRIEGAWLVGCDGGQSLVRRSLGIRLRGEGNLLELQQALFRCDGLFERLPIGPGPGRGRHYHVADANHGFLIMQDSTRHWTLHATLPDAEAMRRRFAEIIALPLPFEMLYCAPWRQNLLLAERYRDGRVLLAGDAVHLVIPTGGLGMNTGVGDAFDLAWKLWGTLRGWGGPGLLASYEIERRQVAERNIGASRYASLGRRAWRAMWRPEIAEDSPAGEAARAALAAVADIEQRKTNEMIGAELGYRYVDSPIIDDIPGGPEHLFRDYRPTTWPGARLPHLWLPDGRALQDAVPDDAFTLLAVGPQAAAVEEGPWARAFAALGAPFRCLRIPDRHPREIYGHDLLLLRPDLHIVWRGGGGADPRRLAAIATGRQQPPEDRT
ncbi:MAG: FAD-dependent monooxygenase [Acetobacteraceae bacterium]|nr:FAD-dependent monooxygenase [Acetobacteraceae bacterium]MCX7683817.1 FAD-dependent monooxygenase [Acetobacteraceae bacterium]MDW8397795.1 FAD-dependent monooxygenase [Acetobacteraceae bacterium]